MKLPHIKAWHVAFTVLAVGAAVFLGCEGEFRRPTKFTTLNDLDRPDCRLGVYEGTGAEEVTRRMFPNAQVTVFDDPVEAGSAMLGGHLEGFVGAEHVLNVVARAYPLRFRMMDEPLDRHPYHAVLSVRDQKLLADVNAFVARYRKDGTYDKMFLRWCQADEYIPMPKLPEPAGSNGTLRVGTSGLIEPSTFIDNDGNLTGYDIEFAYRLGLALDRKVSFLLKPDGDFRNELAGGKIDIVLDNCNVPECPAGFVFSEPYLDSDRRVLLAEVQPGQSQRSSRRMLEGRRFGVADALIDDPRVHLFVNGFVNTVSITLLSALLGFLIARGLWSLERRLPRVVFGLLDRFLMGLRWTPPLVLLLLVYGGLLYRLSPWLAAVIAFAVWFSAYLAPVAGSDPLSWLPVVRLRLPVLLQWTSVVGYISVFDLTMAADLVCGRSGRAALPLLAVVMAYGLIAWFLDRAVAWVERRYKP